MEIHTKPSQQNFWLSSVSSWYAYKAQQDIIDNDPEIIREKIEKEMGTGKIFLHPPPPQTMMMSRKKSDQDSTTNVSIV
jgi:hypothetical protein